MLLPVHCVSEIQTWAALWRIDSTNGEAMVAAVLVNVGRRRDGGMIPIADQYVMQFERVR